MSTPHKPPFRADHVGSLLRPDSVAEARKKFYTDTPTISAEELSAIEGAAIADVIQMQEDAGLQVATDGELRRYFWHYDFMG
ncbi:MAG: 5-methyltetrahydropteroyltriglutamate--homocysteine S-methyltransferase, partial [Rhodospirillaceae bacterium]|nr:5-methyltetrahydropteroyltriglutamate--homocysteine S-methyltransferase [Rhodospirillaceae bacterium]